MECLTDLPAEILLTIIKYLDIKSAGNLYQTCNYMRNLTLSKNLFTVGNFSMNTLATAKTLQIDFVKEISVWLRELNLCGVSDLTKTLLQPALKRMKSLETLDVTFTKISILDSLELYKSCPTIKNIAINFRFDIYCPSRKLSQDIIQKCQEVYKNFVNVHFILNAWISNLPIVILKEAKIDTLRYTICYGNGPTLQNEHVDKKFSFNHFSVFMLNRKYVTIYEEMWASLLPLMSVEDFEFIIIDYNNNDYLLSVSKMFKKFFAEHYNITTFLQFNLNRMMRKNVAIFLWNKTTKFDDTFFNNLKNRLKGILTCNLAVSDDKELESQFKIKNYDWFNAELVLNDDKINVKHDNFEPLSKKRKSETHSLLKFDNIFKDIENLQLKLSFPDSCTVSLWANSQYLRKLSYLSLQGTTVRYSSEFFNVLFRCCENLVTLNADCSMVTPCSPSIMRNIPLSKSIKNIRIVDRRIDFNTLFSSFSQCTQLENICILDVVGGTFNNVVEPVALFRNCEKMYHLNIGTGMSERAFAKNLRMLNNCKKLFSRHYLTLTLINSPRDLEVHSPLLQVFNLIQLKTI